MGEVEIVIEGDPVLRQKAKPVPKAMFGTKELSDIVLRMTQALRTAPHGVAIASPQIGEPWRIFVVRGFVIQGNERNDMDMDVVFINPKIIQHSRKKIVIEGEGCLSVPNVYGSIERYEKAKVAAFDVTGKKFERGGSDLLAEIFQHEVDHLEGILFIDKAIEYREIKPEEESDEG